MDCERHSSWTMSNSLLILANEFPEYTIADANDKLLEKIEPFSLACWLDECQVYAWPVEHLKVSVTEHPTNLVLTVTAAAHPSQRQTFGHNSSSSARDTITFLAFPEFEQYRNV